MLRHGWHSTDYGNDECASAAKGRVRVFFQRDTWREASDDMPARRYLATVYEDAELDKLALPVVELETDDWSLVEAFATAYNQPKE